MCFVEHPGLTTQLRPPALGGHTAQAKHLGLPGALAMLPPTPSPLLVPPSGGSWPPWTDSLWYSDSLTALDNCLLKVTEACGLFPWDLSPDPSTPARAKNPQAEVPLSRPPSCSGRLQWVKVTQSCPTLRPHGLHSPWNSPGQNAGLGSLSFLQGIFPTQESNRGLLHCRWILYQLSHRGD